MGWFNAASTLKGSLVPEPTQVANAVSIAAGAFANTGSIDTSTFSHVSWEINTAADSDSVGVVLMGSLSNGTQISAANLFAGTMGNNSNEAMQSGYIGLPPGVSHMIHCLNNNASAAVTLSAWLQGRV